MKRSISIPWVSWSVVCKPKIEGGLGVRDLCQVNLALLAKWRWRYLMGEGGGWRDIIFSRYSGCLPSPHLGGRPSGLRGASSWWSNISLLGGEKEDARGWLSKVVAKVKGDCLSTQFLYDPWCGTILFKVHSTLSVVAPRRWESGGLREVGGECLNLGS